MVRDRITQSAESSPSVAADDTIPVDSSSQMDVSSSPFRASQHNVAAPSSLYQDRISTNEFQQMQGYNLDRENTYDLSHQDFNQSSLLNQLMRLDNTPSFPCPPPINVHGTSMRRKSSELLSQQQFQQYAIGSGTSQLFLAEQQILLDQQTAQQRINLEQIQESHREFTSHSLVNRPYFPVPTGEASLRPTNSTISLDNLETENSVPNTTTQTSFYQGSNATTGSFYDDEVNDQIPPSVNESTTTFLNILDPNQSTDAVNETVTGDFSVYNEYDVSNESTDSLPNFNQTPIRGTSYQHPSVNKDLSHLQFFDATPQRRFQSVNYPPINQNNQQLEAESYLIPSNVPTQDPNLNNSITPTISDISSYASSASLHHPIATSSSSMRTFDPSFSADSVSMPNTKVAVGTHGVPLASALIGSSSSTSHRIAKKPSLSRLKTASRKNLNKMPNAIATLEGEANISSTKSSPSTGPSRLIISKPEVPTLHNQARLVEDVQLPLHLQSFPYVRSQSQPQPRTLRTFSNASSSSLAVASTGRPSVMTTPTSAGSGPKSANIFRQGSGITNTVSSFSPGIPSPSSADSSQQQQLWKKNFSLNHEREIGRSVASQKKIQRKKSSRLVGKSALIDTSEDLDPKVKSEDKDEPTVGTSNSTGLARQSNVTGFNSNYNTDNYESHIVSESDVVDDDAINIGKKKLQPPQFKSSRLKKAKSTPLLTRNSGVFDTNKDEPMVKKKHTRRRLLPRSKKGCWICRIKHLKCDEVRPCCGACLRFGLTCDYNPNKPDYVTNKELRQKKLNEITMVRKQNQASEKGSTKKERTKSK
ncbi:UME6 [Candida margitis]|uniref:UME6 n=1 Tax=Candida margitis TaxID=1775924 RepID=UPI00222648BA|nr:UME6 [Candida margitis]KAI5968745.1 UME6 [Candida margitis]